MKKKLAIGLAVLAYLCLAALFFQAYRGYLKRPPPERWDEVNGLLSNPDVYHGEPVRFDPPWLRHYAVDWGRLGGVNFHSADGAASWWLVTDRSFDADEYWILAAHRFGTIDVYKLQPKSGPDGGR